MGQKLMKKQMKKVRFSNKHDPGRDELRPGVAPVFWCERDARTEAENRGKQFTSRRWSKVKFPAPSLSGHGRARRRRLGKGPTQKPGPAFCSPRLQGRGDED